MSERVTVVIAAYNAEETIGTTLKSVRRQTHRDLEIIVVIDGATDGTEKIVRHQAREDDRITIIVTENQGFCAARNTGAQAGSGAFIAPIDADDIWHPLKIERQLEVFRKGGDELGLVYTLYRRIDQWDNVMHDGAYACWAGKIFPSLLLYNCFGNGSSMLIRYSAFEQVGGYAMELNRIGCEDYLLQLLIAYHWQIGVVPEFLTGYRFVPGSASRDHIRMARARLKMLDVITSSLSDLSARLVRAAHCQYTTELALSHARARRSPDFIKEMVTAIKDNPFLTARYVFFRLRDYGFRLFRRRILSVKRHKPPKFQNMEPGTRYETAKEPWQSPSMRCETH